MRLLAGDACRRSQARRFGTEAGQTADGKQASGKLPCYFETAATWMFWTPRCELRPAFGSLHLTSTKAWYRHAHVLASNCWRAIST
jgi:hypothetical protein